MKNPLSASKPSGRSRTDRCRVLLLSPYDAYSHQQWRSTLVTMFPEFDWTVLTLPPRYFSWRVRGNSLSWAFTQQEILSRDYDLLICTSLTDLSGLRGLVPKLTAIPTLVYFHENQFAYPTNGMETGRNDKANKTGGNNPEGGLATAQPVSVEAAMLSIYNALCADLVLFNSQWNYQSYITGCEQLLRKLPDHVPAGIAELISGKSAVQAVPLPDTLFEVASLGQATPPHSQAVPEPVDIVWNHRHEYDKGPDLLLAIVQQLIASGQAFRLHLLGQRFRQRPATFAALESLLAQYYRSQDAEPGINQWLESRDDYLQQLRKADIVLSTASHDFQGLSIQEACIMGCLPVVPDALAYPEFIPSAFRFDVSGSISSQATSACSRIQAILKARQRTPCTLPEIDLTAIQASHCRHEWLAHMNKLL